ncbi:hypothetical protein FQN55_003222 [Onygenales sp. PD_40]|nr:hypothetical protein FQN55_003222 [Onygenales sp. PD_40]
MSEIPSSDNSRSLAGTPESDKRLLSQLIAKYFGPTAGHMVREQPYIGPPEGLISQVTVKGRYADLKIFWGNDYTPLPLLSPGDDKAMFKHKVYPARFVGFVENGTITFYAVHHNSDPAQDRVRLEKFGDPAPGSGEKIGPLKLNEIIHCINQGKEHPQMQGIANRIKSVAQTTNPPGEDKNITADPW